MSSNRLATLLLYVFMLQLTTSVHCDDFFQDYLSEFEAKLTSWPFPDLDLSPQCSNFYNYMNFSDKSYKTIILKLFDSSSKIPTGLASGNIMDIGQFDECYQMEEPFQNETIYGKYCLGVGALNISRTQRDFNMYFRMKRFLEQQNIAPRAVDNANSVISLNFAYCTPTFCTAEDVQKIVSVFLPFLHIQFDEESCSSKHTEPELSAGAIGTIAVLVFFGVVVVVSSSYDAFLYYSGKKPLHEVLLAFSVITNGKKLFKSSKNPDQLLCLNGLKAISMMWVILGHEYGASISGAVINNADIITELNAPRNMFIINAHLSVDTFFTVGGLVTMYTFLKNMDKGAKFNILLYYIHRYLRLTPVLAIIVLINAQLVTYLGNGPFWSGVPTTLKNNCVDYWWSCLLYIQNIVNTSTNCVDQTWYLSIDMQLFLLSPIVLLAYNYQPKIGKRLLEFLMIMGIVVPFTISYCKELNALISDATPAQLADYTVYYYNQTHARFGPYVIGMYFGALIYNIKKNRNKPRLNSMKIMAILGFWMVTLGGLVAALYGGADILRRGYDRVGDAMFNALDKNAWGLLLCILVVLCEMGVGGPINKFLSLPIFQFLSKLSYSMFLVHAMILTVRSASTKTAVKFSHLFVMHQFWGDFMVTLGLSIIFCLMFESPVIIIEKFIFGGFGKTRQPKGKPQEQVTA